MKSFLLLSIGAILCACSKPDGASSYYSDGISITVHIVEKDGRKFAVASSDSGSVSICEVTKSGGVEK